MKIFFFLTSIENENAVASGRARKITCNIVPSSIANTKDLSSESVKKYINLTQCVTFTGTRSMMTNCYETNKKKKKKKKTTFFIYMKTCGSFLSFTLCSACQDYFTHFEPSQSLCGAKTGDPREKNIWPLASRTWLDSHMSRARLEPRAARWRAIKSAND